MDKEERERLARAIEQLGKSMSECLRLRMIENELETLQKYKEETDQFYKEWELRLREEKKKEGRED